MENDKNKEKLENKVEDKVEAADESVSSDDSKAEDKAEAADESKTDENSDVPNTFKLPFIIGKKVGMTQLFSNNGDVFPATVIEAGPCYVTQL